MPDIGIERKYTLVMSEGEARWLRGIMQNPLHGLLLDNEPDQDKYYRKQFFESLKTANIHEAP